LCDSIIAGSEMKTILDEAAEASSYLWENGWAERNAGNLSVDISDALSSSIILSGDERFRPLAGSYPSLAGRSYLVTGTGRRFRDLAKDAGQNSCILRMTDGGDGFNIVWGGLDNPDFNPTSEWPAHLRVHEFLRASGAPENVVLHTHPTEMIALTHMPEYKNEQTLCQALWSMHPEVKVTLPIGIGFARYMVPGTEELAMETVEAFRRGFKIVLWEMHGCVAIAGSVMSAFDLIDTANKSAKILLMCRAAGLTPQGLEKHQQDELVAAFGLKE
jgi:rhamnulose-1-phosphate aldolase